jgi:hypothetical protein
MAEPIQPVNLPSFQYGLANKRAGRSGLSDLADALSQINPALSQFGRIAATRNQLIQEQRQQELLKLKKAEEQEQQLREGEIARGRKAFLADPSGISEELKTATRKGIKAGLVPENINAPFIIGGLQAQSESLVRKDYRDQLRSVVETTDNPEDAIAQIKSEFLKRPEFSDPSVRDYAEKAFTKVDEEFRGDVNNRLDAVRSETTKRAWVELGRPVVEQVLSGELDVNDISMLSWLNHSAGVFEGSHQYAWNNLMKEGLKEGLTSGTVSPTKAIKFLDNLRELDLGDGVKFADADVGDSISNFIIDVENQKAVLEKRALDKDELDFKLITSDVINDLTAAVGESIAVPSEDARRISKEYLARVPKHLQEKALSSFSNILADINKPGNDATKLVVGKLDVLIDEGLELEAAVQEVEGAFRLGVNNGGITAQERNRLLKKIEDSRDFDRLIYKDDFYKNIITVDEEQITGFVKERAAFGPATYEVGYFTELGVPDDVPVEERSTDPRSVYNSILNKKGPSAAKAFVNRRYNAYEQQFRLAFKDRFDSYERSVSMTPEQAKERVREEAQDIRDKVFKQWERESIILANRTYGLSLSMPRHLVEEFGVERFRK